jgi:hypothetical protein
MSVSIVNVSRALAYHMDDLAKVLSPYNLRKALMAECRVTPDDVAIEAEASVELVRRTIRPAEARADTPKVKLVKAIIAHRVGRTVAEMWPEDEPKLPVSNDRATDEVRGQ